MKCNRALEVFFADKNSVDLDELERATNHVVGCGDCKMAADAVDLLLGERDVLVPPPPAGAVDRAIERAVHSEPAALSAPNTGFWRGMMIGAAAAAAIAFSFVLLPMLQTPDLSGTPQIAMAIDEVRDISISLDSVTALEGAEIHVVVSGSIGLLGYGEQKELRWRTDLDAGVNQLTLPVVALGANGGQVLVEVSHGDRERRFLVDIDGAG